MCKFILIDTIKFNLQKSVLLNTEKGVANEHVYRMFLCVNNLSNKSLDLSRKKSSHVQIIIAPVLLVVVVLLPLLFGII